jgi:NAD(P)-dependent dehydrogenase (short-subunit alcohol dehydrogenase family)
MDYSLFRNFLNFKNKIVVITGCNSPLGNEIGKFYLEAGAIVVGLDLVLKKNDFIFYKCDITKERNVDKIFDSIFIRFKKIDILINNAGKAIFDPFEKRKTRDLDDVINVNIKGTFYCINKFSKLFHSKNEWRSIVNISSIYSIISPDPDIYKKGDRKSSEIYGATKSGVNQMTKYFSVHLVKKKIRVNAVSPGGILNKKNQKKSFIKKYSKKNPMNRMAKIHEIVGAIIYLTSSTSSYTTGHNLVVDGGMSSW